MNGTPLSGNDVPLAVTRNGNQIDNVLAFDFHQHLWVVGEFFQEE